MLYLQPPGNHLPPPLNSSRIKDLQYDIKYLELNSIKRSDFSKIIAYIGKLEVGQLKLFGQELQWLQIPSHGANGFERKSLYKNERENYEKFWDDIQVFIKFGCLKDESFYDKVKDSILFKTINSQYITLNDYLENCKEKHENKVFYVSNEEQQSQYIKLFKDYGLDAVILGSTIDNHFISMIEFKNQGVHFNRIDADLSDILKENDNEDNKEIKTDIENLFKDVIGDRINNYSVESLKSEDTPAIILISEQSRRMAEMRSQFAGMDFGMSFEEEKTLVINNNSSIVKKLVSLKDDESKKEQVSLICNQIVDIALLSNKELDSKQLDEFIKRNNQLMSMVISL